MGSVQLAGRLLVSLAVVIGLIWLIARKFRGRSGQKLRSGRLIDVLGKQSLSRSSSVAVVRVGDQALIVGVTDSNVRVLGDIELDAVQAKLAENDPSARRRRDSGDQTAAQAAGQTAARPLHIEVPTDATASLSSGGTSAGGTSAGGTSPGRLSDNPSVPSSPAALAGTLTQADIDAIRAARANPLPEPRQADPHVFEAPGREQQDAAPRGAGALGGSALSPATWRQTIDALRDITVRKG